MSETGFKHIAVTAAEDEDVVIQAGLPRQSEEEAEEIQDAVADEESVLSAEVVEEYADEQDVGADTPFVAEAGAPSTEPAQATDMPSQGSDVPQGSRKPKQDAYRQTTLEDLEGESMPTVQKIVIIAAVVCIIGAIAYYLLFMR